MAQVQVQVGGKEYSFDIRRGENLLLESVSRSVMIPFRCTAGRCGACRVRVLEGAENLDPIEENERMRLGDEQVNAGYRLACQAYVNGDVKVEVPQPKLY
ncbi:ferredoxin [Marinithermofilum abyssi]|jgi:ferredoxin|uniref:Ferredoxin n=1 Tax=Marinithermofilum abyssi TaxID=1571185 RepID=A0A8J2VH92_9BACL|nr:2Fe-2S iron-sulfur cluster-binding protein [Marinithermofilum abyssi]GGE14883.1 ferredoxin [Marinithermofilum abyssi]